MKMVVVTPAVPHPFGDTAAKWYYVLIRELLRTGHQVSVLTVSAEAKAQIDDGESRLRFGLDSSRLQFRAYSQVVAGPVLIRKWRNLLDPCSEFLQIPELMLDFGRELAAGYDVLHLENTSAGWLGLGRRNSLLNIQFLTHIDKRGKKYGLAERKGFWQAERATRALLNCSRNVRVLTERLRQGAREISLRPRYWVVPLAIDSSLYPVLSVPEAPVVGLIGSMFWLPSRAAAERLIKRIWPLVKSRSPQAKLLIAGWQANKYLSRFLPAPDVTLQENLFHPADFFSQVAVMAYAPSSSSGMKIKVMESMAYGVPVVTTSEGVEGIDYQNGVHCWVEEEDVHIAERICRLLENAEERKDMREAARALLESRYSPVPVVNRMLQVYSEVAKSA